MSRSSPALGPTARPGPRLVGRERELEDLRQLLAAHRLVTVVGPGGVGKTSLALEAVDSARSAVTGDVVVCELADVDSPDAVVHAVAGSLGVLVRPGQPVGAPPPGDGSPVLVVLDNCEHVVDAATDVAEQLLAAGQHMRVLATSREPLGLRDEAVMVLDPLQVPAGDDEAAAAAASVTLFAERASRVDPGFVLDPHTLPHVVRICRGLDGLPLALEIAAARVRVLAVEDVADGLSDRFALLRSGTRDTPVRHRDLRAVVDWSWDLLEPAERDLFTALSVFSAGCDLQAAKANAQALGIEEDEVVDLLDALLAKSLMTVTRSPRGNRYGMLETLREYALERLAEAGALAEARDRHADYIAGLARSLRDTLVREWTAQAGVLFEAFANLRSALAWTLEHDESSDRSFDLLAPLWYAALQSHAGEIAELADRALERWPDPAHPRWSEVAGTAATARATLEDYEGARLLGAAAAHATGSSGIGRAFGLCALADVAARADDDPVSALVHIDRADEEAAASGFEPLRCDLMNRRAQLLAQVGRTDEALVTAERAHVMAREQGNAYELAWSQHLVGLLLIRTDHEAAREWLTRALDDARELHYPYGTSSSLRGLGLVAGAEGDPRGAAASLSESLDGFVRAGHPGERWNTVAAALSLLVAAGRRDSAAVLLAGLDGSGVVLTRIHTPLVDDVREQLAAELGRSRVVARARAMSPEQLLSLARDELRLLREPGDQVDVPAQRRGPGQAAELSRQGDLWRVSYAGTTVHLPDLRGIRDLAVLLGQPEREVPVVDLATPGTSGDRVHPDGLGVPGDLGERIDARARAAYAERIRELQAELDEADATGEGERSTRVQEELDLLTRELTTAHGIHGPRRTGDPAEKARSSVTARVRAAIGKIRDVHPELGRHLEASIRTGRFCSYRPERPTTWVVTL